MTGLVDSGMGGVNLLLELRRMLPHESLLLLADYENAPYGTKPRGELLKILEDNIKRLVEAGAERVLIACCTASSLYRELSPTAREISIPIIEPTANAARSCSPNGRIAIIATEGTVRSRAFSAYLGSGCVAEIPAGELVSAVEKGDLGTPELYEAIDRLLRRAAASDADTLILGCTHFHSLEGLIAARAEAFGIYGIVSSAREGAAELVRMLSKEK